MHKYSIIYSFLDIRKFNKTHLLFNEDKTIKVSKILTGVIIIIQYKKLLKVSYFVLQKWRDAFCASDKKGLICETESGKYLLTTKFNIARLDAFPGKKQTKDP